MAARILRTSVILGSSPSGWMRRCSEIARVTCGLEMSSERSVVAPWVVCAIHCVLRLCTVCEYWVQTYLESEDVYVLRDCESICIRSLQGVVGQLPTCTEFCWHMFDREAHTRVIVPLRERMGNIRWFSDVEE